MDERRPSLYKCDLLDFLLMRGFLICKALNFTCCIFFIVRFVLGLFEQVPWAARLKGKSKEARSGNSYNQVLNTFSP